jgi:putative hydrolase of the HAD superfamily
VVTRGIVFDLDDTLFLERDYVRSGFIHVARTVGRSADEVQAIEDWLIAAFEAGVRGDTFDRLLAAQPALAARVTVGDLVTIYRGHPPSIALLPGATEIFRTLAAGGARVAILSDGPFASQDAKSLALGLRSWFDPIVLTASMAGASKPGLAGFESIRTAWQLSHDELAYVADNPRKDFVGPRRLGWRTVRVRMPGQLTYALEATDEAHQPDVEAEDLGAAVGHLR